MMMHDFEVRDNTRLLICMAMQANCAHQCAEGLTPYKDLMSPTPCRLHKKCITMQVNYTHQCAEGFAPSKDLRSTRPCMFKVSPDRNNARDSAMRRTARDSKCTKQCDAQNSARFEMHKTVRCARRCMYLKYIRTLMQECNDNA